MGTVVAFDVWGDMTMVQPPVLLQLFREYR
jgi:hypothetical protein